MHQRLYGHSNLSTRATEVVTCAGECERAITDEASNFAAAREA